MRLKYVLKILLLQIVCIAAGIPVSAQAPVSDTLKLTVKQAEDQFLKNNLNLIAQRYNIDNASAGVITARLFPNPDFNFSNGIRATDETQGPAYKEQSFGISQLFTTAGKRNKSIQLAKIQVDQAKYQFFDLLRTLKYTLRNDFYTIYFQEQSAGVYDREISSLAKTLAAFKEQYKTRQLSEPKRTFFSYIQYCSLL